MIKQHTSNETRQQSHATYQRRFPELGGMNVCTSGIYDETSVSTSLSTRGNLLITDRSGERWRAPTDDAAFAKPVGSNADIEQAIGCIMEEEEEPILATSEVARITSALDSGAVANVVSPDCVPGGTQITPNTTGTHYTGAGGGRIIKHGSCTTIISDDQGRRVICPYNLADVSRPLNSVSQIAGPQDQPEDETRQEGNDVLFSNKRAVVVPPVRSGTSYGGDGCRHLTMGPVWKPVYKRI